MNNESLGQRIKRLRTSKEMTQRDLAEACGWGESGNGRIGNYEAGTREPKISDLRTLATALDVSLMDLIDGDQVNDDLDSEDYELIPQYSAKGSAGSGTMNEHVEVKGGLAFKKEWLARMRLRPQCLRVLYAAGTSMMPTISDGDVLLLDESQLEPRHSSVFAILRPDGQLIVKRLVQHDITGAWTIRSDNPDKVSFPDQPATSHEMADLVIVGRIVWHGGAL